LQRDKSRRGNGRPEQAGGKRSRLEPFGKKPRTLPPKQLADGFSYLLSPKGTRDCFFAEKTHKRILHESTRQVTQKNAYDMDIAQAKRRENIAEYILYLWQLEDLLRALQFSPEAIFSTLIAPRKDIAEEQKHVYLLWYMDIANLLHQEGKDEKGHLEHTLHLIGDLHDLHLQLMKLSVGEHYRQTYAKLEPELPRLRAVVGNPGMNDTELCFRALYAAMLYRIKGEGDKQAVTDTLEYISPVIANLADMYGKVERGEIDLFKTDTAK